MFGLCILGRNNTELLLILAVFNQVGHCVSLSHYRGRCYLFSLNTEFDGLIEGVFARLLHSKVTFSFCD